MSAEISNTGEWRCAVQAVKRSVSGPVIIVSRCITHSEQSLVLRSVCYSVVGSSVCETLTMLSCVA